MHHQTARIVGGSAAVAHSWSVIKKTPNEINCIIKNSYPAKNFIRLKLILYLQKKDLNFTDFYVLKT